MAEPVFALLGLLDVSVLLAAGLAAELFLDKFEDDSALEELFAEASPLDELDDSSLEELDDSSLEAFEEFTSSAARSRSAFSDALRSSSF